MSSWLKKAKIFIEKNPNIEQITNKNVAYTMEFKKHAVEESDKGFSASEIFSRSGFDLSLFPPDYPRDTVKRWRRSIKKNGMQAFLEDRRGRHSTLRSRKNSTKKLNESELRARVAYLEAEVDFLKKLRALAKQGK